MSCLTPEKLKNGETIPCGRCAVCITRKRDYWTTRLHFEALNSYNSLFLTYTYSDENLVYNDDRAILNYKDLKDYFKRLRKAGLIFKYFAVGEYGEKTERPHYHAILFFRSQNTELHLLEDKWKLGHVHFGMVTMASLKYVTKDLLKEVELYEELERSIRPKILVSNAMGIDYVEKLKSWHKEDNINRNYVMIDGIKHSMPRYYRQKIYSRYDRDSQKIGLIRSRKINRSYDRILSEAEKKRIRQKELDRSAGISSAKKKVLKIRHLNKKIMKRSSFDLTHERKFTMQADGTLYPIMCEAVVPGDKFRVTSEILARFTPFN